MPLNSLIADFETASALDVTEVGSWRYAEDPTTQPICLGYKLRGNKHKLWKPGDDVGELREYAQDSSITWIAFNCAFERAIWLHVMAEDYGLPLIPLHRWHDIQAAAAMRGLPQNLEDLAVELGTLAQKDPEGKKILRAIRTPDKAGNFNWPRELLEKAYAYCLQDVDTEEAVHERLGFLPPGERRSWLLTTRTNERGIGLDLDYIKASQEIVDRASPPLVAEFKQITGYNPGQNKKVMEWLGSRDVNIPNLRKETLARIIKPLDGDTDDEVQTYDDDGLAMPADVRRALHIRQLVGSASIKKLAKMEATVSSDGRARGLLHWHGTGPGRNAGRLLQPQNFPKPTLKADDEIVDQEIIVNAIMTRDPEYVEMMVGPPIETVAGGLRHALQAGKGRAYISGDYAGIQARLVLAVAGQTDKCDMMALGTDVYIDMGSLIFDRPIDKKKDPWERGIGKNSVLGLGFQMGAATFATKYVTKHPLYDTAEGRLAFCQTCVTTYRKRWAPMVPPLWYALEEAAVKAVWDKKPQEVYGILYALDGDYLTCRLPSGRKIYYYQTRPFTNYRFDERGRHAIRYSALAHGMLIPKDMFGGKNTENVIMGMEADLMRDAQEKCEANGLPVVLDVHDELVVEPLTKDADPKVLKQIMLDIPQWAIDLKVPINVDVWCGDRYRK